MLKMILLLLVVVVFKGTMLAYEWKLLFAS